MDGSCDRTTSRRNNISSWQFVNPRNLFRQGESDNLWVNQPLNTSAHWLGCGPEASPDDTSFPNEPAASPMCWREDFTLYGEDPPMGQLWTDYILPADRQSLSPSSIPSAHYQSFDAFALGQESKEGWSQSSHVSGGGVPEKPVFSAGEVSPKPGGFIPQDTSIAGPPSTQITDSRLDHRRGRRNKVADGERRGVGSRKAKKRPEGKHSVFHCTFRCGAVFPASGSSNWKRHELTKHLLPIIWICRICPAVDTRARDNSYSQKHHDYGPPEVPRVPALLPTPEEQDQNHGFEDSYFRSYATRMESQERSIGSINGPQDLRSVSFPPGFRGCGAPQALQQPESQELSTHFADQREFARQTESDDTQRPSRRSNVSHSTTLESECQLLSPASSIEDGLLRSPCPTRLPGEMPCFPPKTQDRAGTGGGVCPNASQPKAAAVQARKFSRKDNLSQHLLHTHRITEWDPAYEMWKQEVKLPTDSKCGFCGATFDNWDLRTKHIAAEFRKGKTMDEWKGGLGLSKDWEERLKDVSLDISIVRHV